MKILFFIRSLDIGGSQRQLTLLARGLAQRGHDVAVAVLYRGYPMEDTLKESGVRLITVDKMNRWDLVWPLARLSRLFRAERPEIAYCFLPTQTTLAALLLPPWLPTQLVFGIRAGRMELQHYDALSRLSYRLEAWLSRRADLVIANAHTVRADAVARGLPANRIAVVPNGIDTQAMRPDQVAGRNLRQTWAIGDTKFVIGMVARLDPMKDHPNFLRAAAMFTQRHSDSHFVCVGNGPATYRDQLEALARSYELSERVTWVGEADATRAVYNAFDIATLSSSFGEGFPNVIGEAMACGTPVVGTNVGDTCHIIDDNDAVVPPRQPELLSEAWTRMRERLVQDTARLRANVRQRIVRHYDMNSTVDRTEEVLRELWAGRAAANYR